MSCCSSLSVGGPLRLVLGLRPVAVLMVTSPIYRTRSHTEVKGNAKLSGNSRDGT